MVVEDTRRRRGLRAPAAPDPPAARGFLDSHGLGAGAITAEPIGDGHSNVTYLLRRGDEQWVLRRPPRPPLPPSAHDVLREYRILSACADSPVRVPAAIVACDDAR